VSDRGYLTIGEVIARLSGDFPDVTISKIRFLESEGLISPQRTSSGYRRFTESDVRQLRWVLTAQRDQYLPLRVIRQRLAGEPETGGDAAHADTVSAAYFQPSVAGLGELSLDGEQLARAAGLPVETVGELVAHGLIPAGPRFDGNALLVAKAVAQLAEHGLEPRHLRLVVSGAARTVDLLGQLVEPLRRVRGSGAGEADRRAAELAGGVVRLHAALVRSGLAERARV
jgi:DNA-binding transcriptional MerR regulator